MATDPLAARGPGRAVEHREYVRSLLSERQPEFFAALQAAERQLDLELSSDSQPSACSLPRTAMPVWSAPRDRHRIDLPAWNSGCSPGPPMRPS
jgi:hypothetical protein